MRGVLCALMILSGCTEQVAILDRGSAADDDHCMCEEPQLCAADHCVDTAGITSLSAGYRHTCRVKDGALECWGENRAGQLGLGDSNERKSPTRVGDGSAWLEVSSAEEHTCAIASPGRLYCWGNNMSGQLGTRDRASQNTPRRVGTFDDFLHVYSGGDSTCALRAGGAMYCWGATGQLLSGTGDIATPEIVDEPIEVVAGSVFREVSLGASHACAIRQDRALFCWGQNGDGQLGLGTVSDTAKLPTQLAGERWEHVAAGQHHTCGIRDGVLFCWGRGDSFELGLVNNRRRNSALVPQRVGDAVDWASVAVGTSHSCAINDAKRLFCWGRNAEAQCGMTASPPIEAPVPVDQNTRFRAITLGAAHSCALDTGQTLYCWGANDEGQLGFGDHMPRMTPTDLD